MAKLAVVGANGNMGLKRVKALRHLYGDAYCQDSLVLCDLQRQHIDRLDISLAFVDDYRTILADPAVTSVILSTPNGTQRDEMLIAALQAGKHVLVEKPLSLHEQVIHEAFEKATRASLSLKTAYNLDYFPGVQMVQEHLPHLGEMLLLRTFYGNGWLNPLNSPQSWIFDVAAQAGVEYYMGCHMVSLLWLLAGERPMLKRNIMTRQVFHPHYPDTAVISIELDSLLFIATVSWTYWRNKFELNLMGTDGVASVDSMVKYIKYGQNGEQVLIARRQQGLPAVQAHTFSYDNVDPVSADLEYLDVEMQTWLNDIGNEIYDTEREYRKNLFIHRCLQRVEPENS